MCYRVRFSKTKTFKNKKDEAEFVAESENFGFVTETKILAENISYVSQVKISQSITFEDKEDMENVREEYRENGFKAVTIKVN